MAYELQELIGSLWRNKDKTPENKQPDYRGSLKIGGVEYWQSAWLNKAPSGETYMSFKYEQKVAQDPKPQEAPAPQNYADADDPF